MKTLQDVAQAMLDRYGYFVICSLKPRKIGTVRDCSLSAGRFDPKFPEKIVGAKVKFVAKATADDLAKQCALANVPWEAPSCYMYRAVAE